MNYINYNYELHIANKIEMLNELKNYQIYTILMSKTQLYSTKKTYTMDITKKDKKFINDAIEASKNSTMLMKHGCVVVENNRVIAKGWNNYRTRFNDNFIGKSCSCHAEMHALRQVLKTKIKGKASPCIKKVGRHRPYEKGAFIQTKQKIKSKV